MDSRHYDVLSRAISTTSARRTLLGLLATLPVIGGLFGILSLDDAEGAGRRRRRKKRHKHGKGRRRNKRRKSCKPQPVELTCAGKCGSVINNCKKTVDCGLCDCSPACESCFTCQGAAGAPGTCVPQEDGAPCGAGNVCCSSTCQECCDNSQCENPTPICADGACTACSSSDACAGDEFCCGGSCLEGVCCDNAECAPTGDTCDAQQCQCGSGAPCASGENCCAGTCSPCGCDQTQLSNGTCATPCQNDSQCCDSCELWQTDFGLGFCSTGAFPASCGLNGDNACEKGMFCTRFGFCTPVCS